MVRCIEWNIKSSCYTYHGYTSKYKNNHVEPSILSLHWIFLYSSRYHTTIPPYIQSRSGAFKNTTSIQYTMFFQFTIPTVLKQWKICVKRSKIPFDWAYVIHGHFHMHRINEIPLIYINKNSDIQSHVSKWNIYAYVSVIITNTFIWYAQTPSMPLCWPFCCGMHFRRLLFAKTPRMLWDSFIAHISFFHRMQSKTYKLYAK